MAEGDGLIECVEERHPANSPGLCCTWELKHLDLASLLDDCEDGDVIELTFRRISRQEFDDLGEFEGW